MESFRDILRKRTNVSYKDIFNAIFGALDCINSILPGCSNEAMHACCHALTSVAHIESALLAENVKTVYTEKEALEKFVLDAVFNSLLGQR